LRSILILGGARSGKSRYALELAQEMSGKVLFVATAAAEDEEMRQRIEAHRRHRPGAWCTLEATRDIGRRIEHEAGDAGVVIIDCITLLLANIFGEQPDTGAESFDSASLEVRASAEIDEIVACMKKVDAAFILVSNEVGWGLVPPNRMGRLYRDMLGKANQTLAQSVGEVYLMVAGFPLVIKAPGP